ncbi:MAG: hypothetical protein K2V38_25655, partial [Gemmataceae bacterium]|nr:hypothetical protein [Gemmataceae bacterium]
TGLDFTLQASDSGAPYGVKVINLRCPVRDGVVESNSPVQRILFDTVTDSNGGSNARGSNFGTFDISVVGRLDTLKATEGTYNGTLTATSFGTIEALFDISGNIGGIATRGITTTSSIDSIRAGRLNNLTTNVSGGIRQIVIGEAQDFTVTAGWIGTLLVTGGDDVNGIDGDFRNSTVNLNATTAVRSRALDTLTIDDDFENSDIVVTQTNVGTATFRGNLENGSTFLVGVVNSAVLFTGNSAAVFGTNTFQLLRLNLFQEVGSTSNKFTNATFAAPTIATIFSNQRIDATNGGTALGFVFNTSSSVSIRRPDGTIFTSTAASFSVDDFFIRNL